MEAIKFTDVNFTYPLCEKKALDNINLTVDMSEFIVLCGKSGCGKSTLLRHLKKNLTPYGYREGSVRYRGEEIAELDDRLSVSEIGYVQQNTDNQIVTDKVWHELAFGLESLGFDNASIRRRVADGQFLRYTGVVPQKRYRTFGRTEAAFKSGFCYGYAA